MSSTVILKNQGFKTTVVSKSNQDSGILVLWLTEQNRGGPNAGTVFIPNEGQITQQRFFVPVCQERKGKKNLRSSRTL